MSVVPAPGPHDGIRFSKPLGNVRNKSKPNGFASISLESKPQKGILQPEGRARARGTLKKAHAPFASYVWVLEMWDPDRRFCVFNLVWGRVIGLIVSG